MSLGPLELLLVIVVAVVASVIVWKTGECWLGLLPLVCLTAAIVSPADLFTTLLIAIPNSVLLVAAVGLARRSKPPGDRATLI